MEDIRKLLEDFEAEIDPESLACILRGLTYALADVLRDGYRANPVEKHRHLEIIGALTHCAELHATLLVRWIGPHMEDCPPEKQHS